MKFKDLLDEEGQGTRELDSFLHQLSGNNYKFLPDAGCEEFVPNYTTGGSFQEIWELAVDYLDKCTLNYSYGGLDIIYAKNSTHKMIHNVKNEQLAIAEALFKAYQNES